MQPDPDMQKLGVPMLEDLISAENLAKGQNVEDVKTFFKLTIVPTVMGRPFMMATRRAESAAGRPCVKALYAMVKDPKFLAGRQKAAS